MTHRRLIHPLLNNTRYTVKKLQPQDLLFLLLKIGRPTNKTQPCLNY